VQHAANRIFVPESVHVARTLLNELRSAHRRLIAEMAAMDQLTNEEAADVASCATARWRLGQASLQRRLIAARICDYFLHRLDPARCDQLKQLICADQALLRESSSHLGRWSAGALQEDWAGFGADSRELHRRKHAHVAMEQKLLYPLLQDAAKTAA
jgi:hypothetical protein